MTGVHIITAIMVMVALIIYNHYKPKTELQRIYIVNGLKKSLSHSIYIKYYPFVLFIVVLVQFKVFLLTLLLFAIYYTLTISKQTLKNYKVTDYETFEKDYIKQKQESISQILGQEVPVESFDYLKQPASFLGLYRMEIYVFITVVIETYFILQAKVAV